jgi:hypothetical protein
MNMSPAMPEKVSRWRCLDWEAGQGTGGAGAVRIAVKGCGACELRALSDIPPLLPPPLLTSSSPSLDSLISAAFTLFPVNRLLVRLRPLNPEPIIGGGGEDMDFSSGC